MSLDECLISHHSNPLGQDILFHFSEIAAVSTENVRRHPEKKKFKEL